MFNGTGSYDYSRTRLYDHITTLDTDLDAYASGEGYTYTRLSANNHIRMGAFVSLNMLPATGVVDILTYDEDPEEVKYGWSQVHLSVDSNGTLLAGTRFFNGAQVVQTIGPFSGDGTATIDIDDWRHIGLDFHLPHASGEMQVYLDGAQAFNKSLVGTLGTAGIETENVKGPTLGYGGILDTGAGNNFSVFRVGGDIPRDYGVGGVTVFRQGDFNVADWVIGFGLDSLTGYPDDGKWDWAALASTGIHEGLSEVAIANGATVGHVSGQTYYATGLLHYPATAFDDAGSQVLWITANGGNDYGGLGRGGLSVFDDGLFVNAPSYYAEYDNDNAQEILGSTDSPIQIGTKVPAEGVNLALVSVTPWTPQQTVTAFDLSDRAVANITPKIHGDIYMTNFFSGEGGLAAENIIESDDIRVGSIPLFEVGNPNPGIGYFMHLIGGESKAVYIDSAINHSEAAADDEIWFKNIDKVQQNIQLQRFDGTPIQFDEFPFRVIPSTTKFDGTTHTDRSFTVLLLTEFQGIGDTVFIKYPSKDLETDRINLQDMEAYNPVPTMRRVLDPSDGLSGYFYMQFSQGITNYDMTIFEAGYDDYTTNNQASL
jgi:hypothetical protein